MGIMEFSWDLEFSVGPLSSRPNANGDLLDGAPGAPSICLGCISIVLEPIQPLVWPGPKVTGLTEGTDHTDAIL